MKKSYVYALMSAIAFVGAAGLTACSSSDEIVDNPDYNPETNTVKTQFAISLQNNVLKNTTRMAASNVQKDGTLAQFKGITDMYLLPFNATTISSTTSLNGSVISLSPDIEASTTGTAQEKVQVYSNVQVLVETNRFLFYGHAKDGAEGFEHGALSMPTSYSDLSGITFSPKPINATIDQSGTEYSRCKKLLELLTNVAKAKSGSTTWGPAVEAGETQTNVAGLQSMYNSFISLKAGSSEMVRDALEDLYNGLSAFGEDVVAIAIKTAILASDVNSVSSNVLTLGTDYTGYPGNLKLPNGAARIEWDATNKKFVDKAITGGGDVTALNLYAYPANIQYFVDSPIKTQTSNVLDDSKTWTENLAAYSSGGTSVSSSTRSVALETPVKYGVGLFDVKVNQLNTETYYDKKGQAVDVSNGFTLKGILIGGQKPVDYKFEQTTGTSYTIYDNVMPTNKTITASAAADDNYTLVLQTKKDDADGVNFALELVNNGEDFEGKDGIIPKNGTFYLVGTLNASGATNNASVADDIKGYVFKQDYVTTATCTIANGTTAGSGGLANATNSLPDLTAPSMELGFSVDLIWKSGLEFTVSF